MTSSARDGDNGALPQPDGARTVDDLVSRLRELRAWAGVSEREVHRRVCRARADRGVPEVPAFDTVHRCFQRGRRRLDADLPADVAEALVAGGAARWRAAYARVVGGSADAGVAAVAGAPPDDLPAFTGREAELAVLLAPSVAPRVTVVEGMAGIGKAAVGGRRRDPERLRQMPPRTAAGQHVHDGREHGPLVNRRSTASLRTRRKRRQQRSDKRPEIIRNQPLGQTNTHDTASCLTNLKPRETSS
nr:hypothetical protein [Streptomyces sp. CMB-StM0423]